MQKPKLRDSKRRKSCESHPLGQIPDEVIYKISQWIVYYYAVGKSDINGDEWGDVFAKSIGGQHLSSPLGLVDVVLGGQAWSTKSVKNKNPHQCKTVRVISGRNSPDYSYGMENPHKDVDMTGKAILSIWNERVGIASDHSDSLRTALLIREPDSMKYALIETEIHKFNTAEYVWKVNKKGNLEGFDHSDKHVFTWQPHGSQFTILYDVPMSSRKFEIKRPPVLNFVETLEHIGFEPSWVSIS